MKRLLLTLARRFFGFSGFTPLTAVPVCDDWTQDDAARWKDFLRTPAGHTLWQRARAREASLCVSACSGQGDPKVAGGFTFALNWLEGLAQPEKFSSSSDANEETTETGTHEDAGLSLETSYT